MRSAKNGPVQARILTVVVQRFVNLKQPTLRKDLILKFQDPEAIQDLLNRSVLRRTDAPSNLESYLPTAAAFEFSDDSQLRESAKLGVTVVLHAFQNMYRVENKDWFTFQDLLEHVHRIYPNRMFDEETLRLGLYLVQDFGVLTGRSSDWPNPEMKFQVGEGIVTRGDLETLWDRVTSAYKPRPPARLRKGRVAPAMGAVPDFAIEGVQEFLPAGSQHDAYVRVRKILRIAKRSILIVDTYVDETLWELLTNVPQKIKIAILTKKMQHDFRLEGRKFIAQHGNVLEVRRTSSYHDRFIIVDQKRCWHIGASIKDAGEKAFALSELVRPDIVGAVIADVEKEWSSASPVVV